MRKLLRTAVVTVTALAAVVGSTSTAGASVNWG